MRKSKDFYTTQKLFTIYALVVEDQGDTLVFIWKTSSKDLKAVLRRHLRGKQKEPAFLFKQMQK
jgi:hypothetical protein